MPKVSVIIPAFNAQDYIAETLQSVLNQTFQDFEVIVVDDGSTDKTKAVVETFAKLANGKIRYIYQKNVGPGSARNHAIRESRGAYLAMLDADDLWMPNRLMEGVKVLDQNPQVALVHGRTIRINEQGKELERPKRDTRYLSGKIFKHLLLRRAHISCLTVLLRKGILAQVGAFDESSDCVGVEDRDLWLRIAKNHEVAFIDQELGYYRVRAGGISRDTEKMVRRKSYVIEKACAGGQYPIARQMALAQVHKESGDELLWESQFVRARQQYKKALSYWPWDLYIILGWIKTLRGSSCSQI